MWFMGWLSATLCVGLTLSTAATWLRCRGDTTLLLIVWVTRGASAVLTSASAAFCAVDDCAAAMAGSPASARATAAHRYRCSFLMQCLLEIFHRKQARPPVMKS